MGHPQDLNGAPCFKFPSPAKPAWMGYPIIYGFAGAGFAIAPPASVYSLVQE